MTPLRSFLGLVVWLAVCFGAAAIGSLFTGASVGSWYQSLKRPAWTPPNWLFGPVWTLLYAMMAVAAWLVWRRAGLAAAALPIALFALQLAFNVGWSALFFGLHRPGPAFAEIVALWALILATLLTFWRVSAPAGALLVPYLLWVTFAACLNFAIWRMNA
jgi:tryptophan-rich sensory protein